MDVYFFDTVQLEDPLRYEAAYREVDDERRRRIDGFRFEQDRRLSLGAGILLKRALADKGIRDMEIAYMPDGKPCLRNSSEWHFSLSHSGAAAMCVLAAQSVGCDIERIGNPPLKVARKVFSKEEQAILYSLEDEDKRKYFYALWTAKESFLKMTGEGLKTMPDDITVRVPLGCQIARGREVTFFDISYRDDYQAAVCAAGDVRDEQIAVKHVEL